MRASTTMNISLQVFRAMTIWNDTHPCRVQFIWPADAIANTSKTVWVGLSEDLLCLLGRGYHERGEDVKTMIERAMELHHHDFYRTYSKFAVRIGVYDAHCDETSLAFATFSLSGKPCTAQLIPPAPWIHNSLFFSEIHDAGSNSGMIKKCGWRGRISDSQRDGSHPHGLFSPIRKRFLQEAGRNSTLFDASTSFVRFDQQVRMWECFVDVRGAGFSSRVLHIFWSGRIMLYLERPHLLSYAEMYARPWVHYVPATLKNMAERAQWILDNPDRVETIRKNAKWYTEEHLSFNSMLRLFADQLFAAFECAELCATNRLMCRSCQLANPNFRSRTT